jgi:hypothetical protein
MGGKPVAPMLARIDAALMRAMDHMGRNVMVRTDDLQELRKLAHRQSGDPLPVSINSIRQFIADRAPNDEHREDVLSGDYDHTDWFAHVAAALNQGGNS